DGIRDFHVTGVQTCALPISELGCSLPGEVVLQSRVNIVGYRRDIRNSQNASVAAAKIYPKHFFCWITRRFCCLKKLGDPRPFVFRGVLILILYFQSITRPVDGERRFIGPARCGSYSQCTVVAEASQQYDLSAAAAE